MVLISAPLIAWMFSAEKEELWLQLLPAIGIVGVFLAWPRAIHFDEDGIWQRQIFGSVKRIRWNEVDSLASVVPSGPRDAISKMLVAGGNVQIMHTGLHRDRTLFCKLVEERTGVRGFYRDLAV